MPNLKRPSVELPLSEYDLPAPSKEKRDTRCFSLRNLSDAQETVVVEIDVHHLNLSPNEATREAHIELSRRLALILSDLLRLQHDYS